MIINVLSRCIISRLRFYRFNPISCILVILGVIQYKSAALIYIYAFPENCSIKFYDYPVF